MSGHNGKEMIERVIKALIEVPTDREQVWLMDDDPQWRAWALAALAVVREHELAEWAKK